MPAEKTEMVMKNYHDRVRLPRKGLEKGDDTTTGATQKKASLSVRANSKFRHEKKVQADVGNSFGLSVAPNCQQFAKMAQHMPPSLWKSLSMPELPRKKKGHSRDQNWQERPGSSASYLQG